MSRNFFFFFICAYFFIDKIFNTIVITRHVIRIKKNIGSIHNEVNEIKISIHYEIKISIIFIMFIKNNNIIVQQAQHICTAPIQRRTSVEDAGPMLHQCHTNALRPLRGSTGPVPVLCWRTKNQHRLSTSYIQQTRRLDQRWGKAVLALTTLSKLCSRIGPPPAPVCIVLLC